MSNLKQFIMVLAIIIGIFIVIGIISSFSESGSSSSGYSMRKSCSACGKTVSNSSTAGQRCPHCGAYWATENKYTV